VTIFIVKKEGMSFKGPNGSNSAMYTISLKECIHRTIMHTGFQKVLKLAAKTSVV
jgi:hypothetical protein